MITLFITIIFLVAIEYKINKINTLDTQVEKRYIDKVKIKKKKVVKKSKKNKELEYWSDVTGREVKSVKKIKAQLSFYSSDPTENAGYNGIDCQGNKLTYGTIANNFYDLGTKIYIEDFGLMTVNDRGGAFNSWTKFDVFMNGSKEYVNSLGIKNRNAWVIEFK